MTLGTIANFRIRQAAANDVRTRSADKPAHQSNRNPSPSPCARAKSRPTRADGRDGTSGMQSSSKPWGTIRPLIFRFVRMAFLLLVGVWIGIGLLVLHRNRHLAIRSGAVRDRPRGAVRLRLHLRGLPDLSQPHVARAAHAGCRRATRNCPIGSGACRKPSERERAFLDLQGDLIVRRAPRWRHHLRQRGLLRARGRRRGVLAWFGFRLQRAGTGRHRDAPERQPRARPDDRDRERPALDRVVRRRGARRRWRHRNPERRPRRHRSRHVGTGTGRRARPGRSREPRQVALSRDGEP